MEASRDITRLLEIMAALRTPGTGCPWDLEQNFATIAPYTLEEAYEVADAIARGDLADLREELGDLLLQVVFHARMAEEQGAFDFGDVVQAITEKLLRRHPHVFGDQRGLDARAVEGLWQRIKTEEKAAKAVRRDSGALAGVPVGLPALTRALKLQQKAGKVGFDWNDPLGGAGQDPRGSGRDRGRYQGRQAGRGRRRSRRPACSRWSISPAISMPIRKRRCARPMRNSCAALRR